MTKLYLTVLALLTAMMMDYGHSVANGQDEVEIEPDAVRVRIINDTGFPIRVKIIPYSNSIDFFNVDMGTDDTSRPNLRTGQRVLCVWRRSDEKLVIAARLNVKVEGRLIIPSAVRATEATAEGEPAPVPVLEIVPEE